LKYPETLSDDLKYLAAFYQWNAEDKKEVRAAFTDCEPMVRYFTILAAAHRAGYVQGAANGFVRLKDWCLSQGLPDPYGTEFDPAALDQLKKAA
jgi:hypothetical protein